MNFSLKTNLSNKHVSCCYITVNDFASGQKSQRACHLLTHVAQAAFSEIVNGITIPLFRLSTQKSILSSVLILLLCSYGAPAAVESEPD